MKPVINYTSVSIVGVACFLAHGGVFVPFFAFFFLSVLFAIS